MKRAFHKFVYLSYCILAGGICFAQADTINVLLTPNIGNGPFKGGLRVTYMDSTVQIKNVPMGINDSIIKYVDFSYKPVPGTYGDSVHMKVHFLVGFKSDSICVIADLNNNLDFSDDTMLLYPKRRNTSFPLPYLRLNVNLDKNSFVYTFQPYPYPTNFRFFSKKEETHYLLVKTYEYRTSKKFLDNSPLYLMNSYVSPFFDNKKGVEIAIKNNDNDFTYYSIGDAIIKNNFRFYIEKINPLGDTLTIIKTLIDSVQTGYSEGLTIKPFRLKNLMGEYKNIPSSNKFTLIDFWGTWCAPCKELTPYLKSIHSEFKSIVDFESIAYDDDRVGVKTYITNNKMLWDNFIESFGEGQHPVIDIFRIENFPTFLLLDSTGKIILRGIGKEGIEKIYLILKEKHY